MNPRLSNGSATLFAALAMPGLFLCACGGDSGSTSATPAPTVSIGISPASVPAGQPAMLTWSSNNASTCQASGAWTGSQSMSGSLGVSQVTPGTYTYTLACSSSSAGAASRSATLTVTAPTYHFKVETDTPAAVGGTPMALTVIAVDAMGNAMSNFSGTLQFSSTDPHAVLPEPTIVTENNDSFIVSLSSPGAQTITVSDAGGTLIGTSDPIDVTDRPALVITTLALPQGRVGIPYGSGMEVYRSCVWSPVLGWHYACTPITLEMCRTLPACGRRGISFKPCCSTEPSYVGATLSATGAINGIKWAITGAPNSSVPPGLQIEGDSLVGTPQSAGNYEVLITAVDNGLPPAETSVSLRLVVQ